MNVAIINNNNLNDYVNLLNKINNLRMQCNFGNIYLNTPIKKLKLPINHYIIYNSNIPFDNSRNFFANLQVIAYLKIISEDNDVFDKIYDICVNVEYRNKKIISNLLKSIIKNYTNTHKHRKRLWLGVDVNNPYFIPAIKSYVKAGFRNPQLKNYTPNGVEMPFYFVELTTPPYNKLKKYLKSSQKNIESTPGKQDSTTSSPGISEDFLKTTQRLEENPQYILELSDKLKNFIHLVNNHICQLNIFLSVDLTNLLYEFLNYDVEVGGAFQKYTRNIQSPKHNFENIELIFNKKNLSYGDAGFTVNVPKDSEFTFHTHPRICYEHYSCFIGWPSGGDMRIIIQDTVKHNAKCQLVVSVEGIYFVSLTTYFQYFLMVLSQSSLEFDYVFKKLTKNINDIFDESLNLRQEQTAKSVLLKYDEVFELSENDKIAVYNHWHNITNNLQIRDVFNTKKFSYVKKLKKFNYVLDGLNFKLYNVKLVRWSEVNKNDGINFYLQYVSDKCNIISTALNNYIEMLIN
jgi:ribosomal protein S18 acetylase RimI-like enzyme